jgi:mono/diheme cytochrome c family protein
MIKSRVLLVILTLILCAALGIAQKKDRATKHHGPGLASAPESVHDRLNTYEGKPGAIRAGRKLFERHCAECHGSDARGRGKTPPLNSDFVQHVPPGDLFWFLTNGNLWRGMPSWSGLPEAQRWQIISYLKSPRTSPGH